MVLLIEGLLDVFALLNQCPVMRQRGPNAPSVPQTLDREFDLSAEVEPGKDVLL